MSQTTLHAVLVSVGGNVTSEIWILGSSAGRFVTQLSFWSIDSGKFVTQKQCHRKSMQCALAPIERPNVAKTATPLFGPLSVIRTDLPLLFRLPGSWKWIMNTVVLFLISAARKRKQGSYRCFLNQPAQCAEPHRETVLSEGTLKRNHFSCKLQDIMCLGAISCCVVFKHLHAWDRHIKVWVLKLRVPTPKTKLKMNWCPFLETEPQNN